MTLEIDVEQHRFPYCVVWTPIPCLTWLFPFIGHMGIADSRGVIHDFAGSYFVSEDNMGFGWPTRYWQLSADEVQGGRHEFDKGVQKSCEVYTERMHNLICDNCHSHVARALNEMKYQGKTNWNMISLAVRILFQGKAISWTSTLKQWGPFCIIAVFILIIVLVV